MSANCIHEVSVHHHRHTKAGTINRYLHLEDFVQNRTSNVHKYAVILSPCQGLSLNLLTTFFSLSFAFTSQFKSES